MNFSLAHSHLVIYYVTPHGIFKLKIFYTVISTGNFEYEQEELWLNSEVFVYQADKWSVILASFMST